MARLGATKDAAIFARADLSTNDFEIDSKALGSGASGHVYRARPKGGDGVWYAMKRFDKPAISSKDGNMARREVEKASLLELKATAASVKTQSFIVRLYAVIADAQSTCGKALVYELCKGDVRGVVNQASIDGKTISVNLRFVSVLSFVRQESEVMLMARHLLIALQSLHSNRLVHRDVCLDNLLWLEEGKYLRYKLTDLGLCCSMDRPAPYMVVCLCVSLV